jgi:uncharacterized membrane protein YcaP (DUF421 family)
MESVLRGAAIYVVMLIVVRLSGRRSVAQMTPFDFVLILIVAETTQQALLGEDFSITNSVILILTLFTLDILMSYWKRNSPRTERMLDGAPTILVSYGTPDREALQWSRVQIDDILEAAREQQGVERLEQIKFAILEVGGDLSIIPNKQ